ncbi:LexA family transcriptional regulator [Providencia rettgeri]|uniref:XRE family transcriptional regulator n=1 Tax=Providencia rettgeri TaxID=587 RepID=UPI0032DBD274
MNSKKKTIVEFSERLKSIVPKGSGRDFAHKAGISYSTFHNYMNAQSSPTLENLVLISKACNVSIEWLATGNSLALQDQRATDSVPSLIHKIPFLNKEEFLFLGLNDFKNIDGSKEGLAALYVDTNSMAPIFSTNSIVLVDTNKKSLKESKIMVLQKNEHYLYKLVQVTPHGYLLNSTNPNYTDIIIDNDSLSDLQIVGEVVLILTTP